jgi:methylthioribulose-1-phosphate dehydratase
MHDKSNSSYRSTGIPTDRRARSCGSTRQTSALAPEALQLRRIGARFYRRGWADGTGGNYSVVTSRDPLRLLITASGRHKGALGPGDFVEVDERGRQTDPSALRPSAETLLHVVLAGQPDVGAVLHTHSIWATLLSDLFHEEGAVAIEGYEMLKGLAGISTHEQRLALEIFENSQDIPALAGRVRARLTDVPKPLRYGFLLRRHGLYTWARDLDDALRHVEILEFLFESVGRRLTLETSRAVG